MAEATVTISTFKTAKSSQVGAAFYVDTTELKELGKRLRASRPGLRKALAVRLREVGDIVADAAKAEASFSTRIPGSIKVRVSGFAVKIVANANGTAPSAPAFEHNGEQGTFQHPTFGNWRGGAKVTQHAHPFMGPASISTAVVVEELALAVIDDTLRSVGL